MTGATVNMVKSVSKFTLTKFVKNQTALVINVTKGIQILAKGAGQHVEGHSTFTNQTVCQPIGTDVFGEDILLLVDKTGLASKYARQAVTFGIWPAPFWKLLNDLSSTKTSIRNLKSTNLSALFDQMYSIFTMI